MPYFNCQASKSLWCQDCTILHVMSIFAAWLVLQLLVTTWVSFAGSACMLLLYAAAQSFWLRPIWSPVPVTKRLHLSQLFTECVEAHCSTNDVHHLSYTLCQHKAEAPSVSCNHRLPDLMQPYMAPPSVLAQNMCQRAHTHTMTDEVTSSATACRRAAIKKIDGE